MRMLRGTNSFRTARIVAQRVRGAPASAWEVSSGYCGVTLYLCGGETKANGIPKTLQVHSQPFSNPETHREFP